MKKNPAIITVEDFVFYVIYTNFGGYGYHTQKIMRKDSKKHLVGETIKNGRFKQTEWCCISDSDDGMVSIKYTGILTIKGLKEFVNNFWAADAERTMGSLTEFGHLPAISLQTRCGWEFWNKRFRHTETELKNKFKSKYNPLIYRNQYGEDMNAYISPFIPHNRIDEVFRVVFGSDYNKPEFIENRHAYCILDTIDKLCKKLEDYIIELNDKREKTPELDKEQFTLDCRQLELFNY